MKSTLAKTLSPDALTSLHKKYQILVVLRQQRESFEKRGIRQLIGQQATQRRQQKQWLAQNYPGSLRELECSSAQVLRARKLALLSARRFPQKVELWMVVVWAYHCRMREALAIKMWLVEHRAHSQGDRLYEEFKLWFRDCGERQASRASRKLFERCVHPPEGRLHVMVWQDLEKCYGRRVLQAKKDLLG